MGKWITKKDLELAISPNSVRAIYDDDGDGKADDVAVDAVIDRAEGMAESFVIQENGEEIPPAVLDPRSVQPGVVGRPVDRLFKNLCLQFAIVYSFQRHSEYAKTYGKQLEKWDEQAVALGRRIQQATQVLPDTAKASPPKNVGIVAINQGPTMLPPHSGSQRRGHSDF